MANQSATSSSSASDIALTPVMIGVVLVILLGALEQTIVAVALPAISKDLRGFSIMGWVVSAYLVACTVVTPIYGKLSDTYGRRAALTSAILIFLVASVGCALSRSMAQLIGWRVLQGIGGGGLLAIAQATVADVVPMRERGRYQGYIAGVWALASLAGPVIGGYLTNYLSWHWIFWINLPVGVVALVVIRHALRALPVRHIRTAVDYIGALLFALGLTALLIAITRIGQGVPATEPLNLGLMIGAGLGLAAFGWHETRTADPIIPLDVLRNRTVAICCTTMFVAFFLMISLSVLLPLHLQMIGGIPPDLAALRLLPLTLSVPLGSFIGGRLMTRTGRYKPLQLAGAALVTVGIFILSLVEPHHDVMLAAVMCLLGTGIGLQLPTAMVATQNAVSAAQVGMATSLTAFSRMLGGAVGVAVLTSILIALLRGGSPADAAGSETLADLFHSLGSGTLDARALAARDAAQEAFSHLFMLCAAISLIAPLAMAGLREQELREKTHAAVPIE
jgi:EmrB/QacA subfamily drug resistance transporter